MTTCEIILLLFIGAFLILFFLSWKRVSNFLDQIQFVKDRALDAISNYGVKLWMDHASFMREYIISSWHDLPTIQQTTDRLIKNQDDLARYLESTFDKPETYQTIKRLLEEHISIALRIVESLKSQQDTSAHEEAWKRNADDLAVFLASLSPNYDKNTIKNHLWGYLEATKQEFEKISTSEDGIQEYDNSINHILSFNDYLLG